MFALFIKGWKTPVLGYLVAWYYAGRDGIKKVPQKENIQLPFTVRGSQTSLLKFPIFPFFPASSSHCE